MKNRSKRIIGFQVGVFLIALSFLAIGLARQEHLEVLQKAVKICLECIGIG